MSEQPRYDPFEPSDFFPDRLSARPLPAGVISRTFTETDELLDTGMMGGQPATRFPFPMTMDVMARGQERYNIYCVPCHDFVGTGNGMAAIRGFRRQPATFHSEQLRSAPHGHFFDVITNGFGAMPSYANQIAVPDRWAVIAYIRALQLSQSVTAAELSAEDRQRLTPGQQR
jgi:mono/diheme cytochrome c family protein